MTKKWFPKTYKDFQKPRIFVTCRKCSGKSCYGCPKCKGKHQEEIRPDDPIYDRLVEIIYK